MTRTLRSVACAAIFAVTAVAAYAQNYPSKTVTIVVPQAAGGANDAVARIIAQKLGENLGQAFVVDNRVGAGGNIGTQFAARAPKDGHTLLLTVNSAHVINPWLYKSTGFDPIKDFEPVTPIATVPYLLVANPSFAANNVKQLIDMAKAKPGDLQYASAGNGTLNHLLMEMIKKQAGIDLVHVPYKGAAASLTDVVSGQVPVSFQSVPSSISMVKGGKVKVLAVASQKRVPALPDAPTIGETLKGFGEDPWYGVFLPAGTPKPIVNKLAEEIAKAVNSPDVKEKLAAQGGEPFTLTPDKFAALVKHDLARFEPIVKASGAKVD
ncbi:MAG TPA: tripartite tricarboxylate transporter substrate binding protein [Casimicrobiaceae bacterium]|nr:tripartite tricarboxylate transporter substrate binding protein [Casimicrobiaceae bacterium]